MTVQEVEIAVFSTAVTLAGLGGPLLSFYLPNRSSPDYGERTKGLLALLLWTCWLLASAFFCLWSVWSGDGALYGFGPVMFGVGAVWLVYLLVLASSSRPGPVGP
jgi:hypothetical protein